jgi:tetratricopeptide (TPR) repeat protein
MVVDAENSVLPFFLTPNYISDRSSNRAAAYNGQKEYQKAIDDSDDAIGLIPTYVNAYINRSLAYYHQHKYQQAIADYDKALELDPNNANAYHNRALAYTRLGHQQAAQANQRKAAALSQRQLR